MNDSAKAANLGRWFPPWTVTGEAWHKALTHEVSGVSTDAVLFSERVSQLLHHYCVLGQSVGSLWLGFGSISIPLPRFADKNLVASHVQSSSVATQH